MSCCDTNPRADTCKWGHSHDNARHAYNVHLPTQPSRWRINISTANTLQITQHAHARCVTTSYGGRPGCLFYCCSYCKAVVTGIVMGSLRTMMVCITALSSTCTHFSFFFLLIFTQTPAQISIHTWTNST